MKLGIMQPYFFPYLGYFSLISVVDKWVVFDITQYTPRSWMNRNRILHQNSGWQYITVPLSNSSRSIKIYAAKILNVSKAKENILGKLNHYKKIAPYFNAVNAIVHETFYEIKDGSLVSLNVRGLNAVCQYLDIPFSYYICSELNLLISEKLPPGMWAVKICHFLKATTYFNPAGGKKLFDPVEFAKHNISLNFVHNKEFFYNTAHYRYEPNLSILDLLMWNSPKAVAHSIKNNFCIEQLTPPQ